MKFYRNSVAGALALALSTAALAQGITQKPVTGADRKKTSPPAAATAPATDAASAKSTDASAPPVVASPTVAQPAVTTPPANADEAATPQSTAPGQTGTTPGQAQTSPGQASEITPAQTGTTPSGQTTGNAPAPTLTAATAADVKAGVSVYDQKGNLVGKIDSVSADGAVVSTGKVKAAVPVSSFAKSDNGLVISMTKAEIDAAAKPAAKTPPKKK
jgi:hypothetical protein